MRAFIFFFLFLGLLASCSTPDSEFKAAHSFKAKTWHKDSLIQFKFQISETSPVRNLIFSSRTGSKYPFANIYYRYSLYGPDSILLETKMQQFFVANPVSGKPIGKTIGDMIETDALALDNYRFNKIGIYTLTIQHYMRDTTLTDFDAFSVLIKTVQ